MASICISGMAGYNTAGLENKFIKDMNILNCVGQFQKTSNRELKQSRRQHQ